MQPFPVIRGHFGLPSVEETLEVLTRISQANVIDVISIGPGQNFQESFFYPYEMKKLERGPGGVPIRTEEVLTSFYGVSKEGNFPLLRGYSGTRNLIKMAELLHRTINNALGATSFFQYSELDGRSSGTLVEAITENQAVMAWYGARNISHDGGGGLGNA